MILTDPIRRQILAAIKRDKHRPLVLPEFCYWKGRDQPIVYVDGLPDKLVRILYRELIGPLEFNQTMVLNPGIPPRNVNPYLFTVHTGHKRGDACPNGHPYAGNEMPSNASRWRCRICYEAWRAKHRKGGQSVSAVNRAKDVCPKGHAYSGENLMILRSGRRRCRICHRDDMARYRAEKKAA